jgi:hypothetical protein
VRIREALEEWFKVMPSDIIVGDADGVIAIPEQLLPEITAMVIEWSRSESGAREEIIAGHPLLAALQKIWLSLEIQRIYPKGKSGKPAKPHHRVKFLIAGLMKLSIFRTSFRPESLPI